MRVCVRAYCGPREREVPNEQTAVLRGCGDFVEVDEEFESGAFERGLLEQEIESSFDYAGWCRTAVCGRARVAEGS